MRRSLIAAIVLLAGCLYSPMHSVEPAEVPVAATHELSGSWCFTSGVSRQYGTGVSVPFVPQYDLHEESVITLHYEGNEVTTDYIARDGTRKSYTFDLAKADARWQDGKLIAQRPATKGCPAPG